MPGVTTVTPANRLPLSERGKRSWTVERFDFGGAHAPLTHDIDTIDMGAMSLGIFIRNVTGQTIAVILQASQDGENWTDIAHKDLAGSETASGSFNITNNNSKHMVVHYGSYPEVVACRYFRLTIDPAANVTVPVDAVISLK